MGGGGTFPYPRWVWTPYGGWWAHDVNWKKSTLKAAAGIVFATLVVGKVATENKENYETTRWNHGPRNERNTIMAFSNPLTTLTELRDESRDILSSKLTAMDASGSDDLLLNSSDITLGHVMKFGLGFAVLAFAPRRMYANYYRDVLKHAGKMPPAPKPKPTPFVRKEVVQFSASKGPYFRG